ncbi:hypothetical protein [Streptomyces sp. NPDC007904]|uniref:hypothetical protein n=1 Tax=Streptomyces sp. NPDC007904 TaxID=3364787 RepID=UPI0036E9B8EC
MALICRKSSIAIRVRNAWSHYAPYSPTGVRQRRTSPSARRPGNGIKRLRPDDPSTTALAEALPEIREHDSVGGAFIQDKAA